MASKPLLYIEANHGPAMQALANDQQRDFVMYYCGQGRRDAKQAYALAYDHDPPTRATQVAASVLLHTDKVQMAILEVCQRTLRTLAPLALAVFEEVAGNKSAPATDRLKAATAIADRTGLHAVSEQKTTVQHISQDADQMKRIAALAAILNVDPRVLLGNRIVAPTIDVTPERAPVPEDFADEEY